MTAPAGVAVTLYVHGKPRSGETVRPDQMQAVAARLAKVAASYGEDIPFLIVMEDRTGEQLPFFHGSDLDLAREIARAAGGKIPETYVQHQVEHRP